MKKKTFSVCLLLALCLGTNAQSAIVDGSAVTGKTITKIEFPNNGENIKITYSDNTTSDNLDLSEVTILFNNITDAINYLNADNESSSAPIFYYDMQGRRLIEAPAKGLFIMKKGNKVVKVAKN